MSSFFPPNFVNFQDFSTNFLDDIDFGAEFNYGGDFDLFANDSSDTVYADSYKYDGVLCDYSVKGSVPIGQCRCHQKRRKNRCFIAKCVKTSCWYINFLQPGETRELTHLMSSSDQYGDFRHWFRMPLKKVERLTDMFIESGYIVPSRCAWRRADFCERVELLVMSALYILGKGAAFHSCRALCNISTSQVRKFFFKFLDVFMDMHEEYIKLPGNVAELNRVTRSYASVGLPGACGLMDAVHIKW